ncbi:MAG: PTS ascorbate transporter subunit IIC [Treponema sp.]|nr:PTS ascorbate transporter subunit IIC [Treponema sp.]
MVVLYFLQEVLSTPAVLIALIAFIGLMLQKAPATDVIRGTLKSFLGFILIGAGAGIIVGALEPMASMFEKAFNTTGVIPNNEAIIALALREYGEITALIMFFGMFANLILARLTRLKYVFLTGHHTLYMACLIGVILITIGFTNTVAIVIGSVALGLTMILFPAMAQSTMKKITNTDEVGFGHFSTIGYWASATIGRIVGGKNIKSTEDINFPKSLSFLRDSSVSISITMCIIYIVLTILAGPAFIHAELSGGTNFILYAITLGITFAAGVFVILQGVRLILAEIVPAFKGISERLIPGARPALDCPVVFPYAPNAVLIGFFSSFIGGIIGMAGLIAAGGIIILPGVVPHFFCGATAGVFGNARGGIRGAVLGAFVNGLLLTFAPLILMPLLGNLGFANTTFSDLDFIATGFILGSAGQVAPWLVFAVVFGLAGGLIIFNLVAPKKKAKKE